MQARPSSDPATLLRYWMEWERGETPPGKVMSNLKIAGLRELLEGLATSSEAPADQGEAGYETTGRIGG